MAKAGKAQSSKKQKKRLIIKKKSWSFSQECPKSGFLN